MSMSLYRSPRAIDHDSGSSICSLTAPRCTPDLFIRPLHSPDILLARAGLQALSQRRAADQAVLAFRLHNGTLPPHFMTAFSTWTTKPDRSASLRNLLSFRLPRAKKSCLQRSPLYLSLSAWNSLPISVQSPSSLTALKSYLLSS